MDPPRRPTMADVGKRASVSLKTVSRVLNGVPTVDKDMAQAVLAAVEELGYRRNELARNLRAAQGSPTIGLLIEDLANPFYGSIAAGAAEVAAARDAMLITASSEEKADRERRLLLEMCDRRVDGLLIVPASADHGYLDAEMRMGTPAVFIDRPPSRLAADAVLIDDGGGARQAIEYLVERGHRRIGLLSDSVSIYTMRERLEGAARALADAGIDQPAALVMAGLHAAEDVGRAARQMLAASDAPTAMFCLNNRLTVAAIDAAWSAGSELEFVGFDDFDTAQLMPFPLAVVAYDPVRLGSLAAELLFNRIDGLRDPSRQIVLPTQLIVRTRPARG